MVKNRLMFGWQRKEDALRTEGIRKAYLNRLREVLSEGSKPLDAGPTVATESRSPIFPVSAVVMPSMDAGRIAACLFEDEEVHHQPEVTAQNPT